MWQDEIVCKAGKDWMTTAKDKKNGGKMDSLEEVFNLRESTLEGD